MITPAKDACEHDDVVRCLAAEADASLVIAPEMAGRLDRICRLVDQNTCGRIGPSRDFISWTADKHETALRLRQAGLPHTNGRLLRCREDWSGGLPSTAAGPLVIKPVDGAGSLGVTIVRDRDQLLNLLERARLPLRVEDYYPGRPASVALLLGPRRRQVLQPCWQRIAADENGNITYHGGSVMEEGPFADRAKSLAEAFGERLCGGESRGYIGIDLVLGSAEDGSQDVVMEVNPRFTTSYVGLREAADTNLVEAMLRLSRGDDVEISFPLLPCAFTEDGRLEKCAWLG